MTAPPAGMLAAVPFSLTQQMALNNAMAAYYAANVPPLLPPPVANPLREVSWLAAAIVCPLATASSTACASLVHHNRVNIMFP